MFGERLKAVVQYPISLSDDPGLAGDAIRAEYVPLCACVLDFVPTFDPPVINPKLAYVPVSNVPESAQLKKLAPKVTVLIRI